MRENLNQNNSEYGHFLRSGWLQDIWRHGRKGGGDKFNVNNALICEFILIRSILTYPLEKRKKYLKTVLFQVFMKMKLKEGPVR